MRSVQKLHGARQRMYSMAEQAISTLDFSEAHKKRAFCNALGLCVWSVTCGRS